MRRILVTLNKFKGIAIIGGIVIAAFAFLLNASFTIQLRYENSALKDEIFELENLVLSANQELEKSNTDIHIHKVATERLGLVKSKETPVKIVVSDIEEKEEELSPEEKKKVKLELYIVDWYRGLNDIIRDE